MANEAPAVITSKKSAAAPRSIKVDTPTKDDKMAGQCKASGCMSTSLQHATNGAEYICPVHAAE